jgi:hypothetical protein
MITPLTGTLRRALHVNGHEYTVLLTATGLKLTAKGKRKGVEFTWADLLGEGNALVTALNASLGIAPRAQAANSPEGRTRKTH